MCGRDRNQPCVRRDVPYWSPVGTPVVQIQFHNCWKTTTVGQKCAISWKARGKCVQAQLKSGSRDSHFLKRKMIKGLICSGVGGVGWLPLRKFHQLCFWIQTQEFQSEIGLLTSVLWQKGDPPRLSTGYVMRLLQIYCSVCWLRVHVMIYLISFNLPNNWDNAEGCAHPLWPPGCPNTLTVVLRWGEPSLWSSYCITADLHVARMFGTFRLDRHPKITGRAGIECRALCTCVKPDSWSEKKTWPASCPDWSTYHLYSSVRRDYCSQEQWSSTSTKMELFSVII